MNVPLSGCSTKLNDQVTVLADVQSFFLENSENREINQY